MALIGHNVEELVPVADVGTNNWILSTGTDYFDLVDDWSSATYIHRTSGIGRTFDFTMSDLPESSDTGIVIDSVTVGAYWRCTSTAAGKTESATIGFSLENAAGTSYYTETFEIQTGYGAHIWTGTARTTTDGSTAWTSTTVNGLRVNGEWASSSGSGDKTVTIYRVFLKIKYTFTPPITTYTSDDNIVLKNGQTELKNGMIEIKGP